MRGLGDRLKAGLERVGVREWPGCWCPTLRAGLNWLTPGYRNPQRAARTNARRMLLSLANKIQRPLEQGHQRRVSFPGHRTIGHFPFSAYGASGGTGTINATGLSETAVQDAFNQAARDPTITEVRLPAGTISWTGQVALTLPAGRTENFALLGAGDLSILGGGNATTINDFNTTSDQQLINYDASAVPYPLLCRYAGIRIERFVAPIKGEGLVKFVGACQLRVDHSQFYTYRGYGVKIYSAGSGVADHNRLDWGFQCTVNVGSQGAGDSYGDYAWAHPTGFGGPGFFFIEDNTFIDTEGGVPGQSAQSGVAGDCRGGSKVVVRYNHMGQSFAHGDDGDLGRQRACRALEFYNNIYELPGGGAGSFNRSQVVSGSAVLWGNTFDPLYPAAFTLHSGRSSTLEGPRAGWPLDWGWCGIVPGGGGPSNIDENRDATGYRCLDMVGSGPGDLLANDFPNVVNTVTGFGPNDPRVYPRHTMEPVYEWSNTFSGTPAQRMNVFDAVITQNRDYYMQGGSPGVLVGLAQNRPGSCTAQGAYWATDTQTLYQCNGGVWSVYYQPFGHPHPLVTGSGPTPPAPPSNLRFG